MNRKNLATIEIKSFTENCARYNCGDNTFAAIVARDNYNRFGIGLVIPIYGHI